MAAAKNPIATRVQAHTKQARSMLTPGLRASAPEAQGSRLPAIFTHFSVGKAKEAAQKMRFLDHRRMGKMQAETSKAFSESIPQKFDEVQTLLHINPRVSREATIWSELDKPLPSTQSSAAYEEPPKPGEMRAGTVLQKFSVVPKDGQSIASFKQQTRGLSKPKSAQRAAPPRPVTKDTRLFSRVQEISAAQPQADQTERPPEKPATVTRDTLQRQVDPVSAPARQVAPSTPVAPPSSALSTAQTEPARSKPEQPKVSAEPAPKAERLVAPPPVETSALPSALPLKKIAKAKTAPEQKQLEPTQPLPAAKADAAPSSVQVPPVLKKAVEREAPVSSPAKAQPQLKKAVERKMPVLSQAKALPASKPAVGKPVVSTIQRKVDSPTAPPAKAPARAVQQPKAPDAPDAPDVALPIAKAQPQVKQAEAETSPVPKATAPAPQQESPLPQTALPREKENTAPVLAPAQMQAEMSPAVEMPLRRKLQARRAAPEAIKALRPDVLKPTQTKPLLAPPQAPLIARQKYTRTSEPETAAEAAQQQVLQTRSTVSNAPTASAEMPPEFAAFENMSRGDRPRSAPFAPLVASPSQPSTSSARQPLALALAKTPRAVQPAPQTPERAALPQELRATLEPTRASEVQRPLEQAALPERSSPKGQGLTENVSVSSQKVVQRMQDEVTSDTAPTPAAPAMNLTQLAEDVLPYVKRILEIESERTPGSLR